MVIQNVPGTDKSALARLTEPAQLAVLATLLVAAAVALYGLLHTDDLVIGWLHDGRVTAIVVGAASALLLLLARWRGWPLGATCLLAVTLMAGGAVGAGPVATTLLVLAASLQTGALIAGGRLAEESRIGLPVATAVGLAAMAGLLQLLSRVPLHVPVVYLVALAAPFVFRTDGTRATWRALRGAVLARSWNGDVPSQLLGLAACIGLAITLAAACAPEAGTDALAMHLMMPSMVARDHGWWPKDAGFVWAWMPMAVDWLYAVGYLLADEAGARLLNFASEALLVVLATGMAARLAGGRAGAIAACILATFPVAFLVSTSLFVENTWALWVLAAVGIMQMGMTAPLSTRMFVTLGLLLGAALAAKLMTAPWVLLVLAWLWFARKDLDLRRFAALAGATLLVGSWPYVTAWIETGNPVLPFMNDIFRSRLAPATAFQSPFTQGLTPTVLYDLTFRTPRYLEASVGGFGLAFLVLLPAGLLAALWRGTRWIRVLALTSVAVAAITVALTSYARYLAPVCAIWAIVIGVGIEAVVRHRVGRAITAGGALLTGVAGLVLLANASWWYRGVPLAGLVDPTGFRDFEVVMRPEADMVRHINMLDLKHVLWVGRSHYAGLRPKVTTTGWHQSSGWDSLHTHQQLLAWVRARGFDGVVIGPDVSICQTVLCEASDSLGQPDWTSGPMRFYRVSPGTLRGLRPLESGPHFVKELVKDPQLTEGSNAWGGSGDWDRKRGVMTVTADRTFSQGIAVRGGGLYQYRIRARCVSGSGHMRAQVNWLDKDGSIVQPVIELVPCTSEWTEVPMNVVAPSTASVAMVYAAAHDPGVVGEVDFVSLRE